VDFRPVETIIQIGGPKGVARFIQRAGRSGHQPGAISKIYFVPTHSLELLEGAALKQAIFERRLEARIPYTRSLDVLIQYLMTLAVSDGFYPKKIFREVKETYCFRELSWSEMEWILNFLVNGGFSLQAYDEYKKVEVLETGMYKVNSRRIALRHRLSMGTIVSDQVLQVRYQGGRKLGTIEEWFISKLRPGDVFWFSGRSLELKRIKDLQVIVTRSKKKNGRVPAWMGSRMPLSSQMAEMLRAKLTESQDRNSGDKEIKKLMPLIDLQAERSHVPGEHQLLLEYIRTREGFHLFVFPFEGRLVHEGLVNILAYRISLIKPLSFSIALNDYGFELLSDQPIPVLDTDLHDLFSPLNLREDIETSMNLKEMARRTFRDIASISGLVFQGYPGKPVTQKHIQSSTQILFDVFHDYEPDHLLLKQAYEEVLSMQLQVERLKKALNRIQKQEILFSQPAKLTPFSFPILVDRLREKISYESLEDRIKRMTLQLEKSK
jgi:ATP-dependent Lhr-like helicase